MRAIVEKFKTEPRFLFYMAAPGGGDRSGGFSPYELQKLHERNSENQN